MKFQFGNLWENISPLDLVIVPGSRTLDGRDSVFAYSPELQRARSVFEKFPEQIGRQLDGSPPIYGLVVSPQTYHGQPVDLGMMQVRTFYRYSPSIDLLKDAVKKVCELSSSYPRIILSFPEELLVLYSLKEVVDVLHNLPENAIVFVPRPKKKVKSARPAVYDSKMKKTSTDELPKEQAL